MKLNSVSILFYEIFRINVELNFVLKFWSVILSEANKFLKMPGKFQNLAAKFYKGLTQNSTTKLKVGIQFYVDYENFMMPAIPLTKL